MHKISVLLLSLVLVFTYSACTKNESSSSPAGPTSISLSLAMTRDSSSTPNKINFTVTAVTNLSQAVTGLTPEVTATGGTASAVTDAGSGSYTFVVTPTITSGELPVSVSATWNGTAYSASRTPLVLPIINSSWGQPESLRGVVNTAGYEDGPEISPDGQWLALTDYSPYDLLCCLSVNCGSTPNLPGNPHCQNAVGPYNVSYRPDMPGMDRVASATQMTNKCPKTCYTSDLTGTGGEVTAVALPPIGAFIFQRQSDGTFDQPYYIGFDADGCNQLMGLSFVAAPSGTSASMIFATTPPFGSLHNIYYSNVTLGQRNVLGTYSCAGASSPVLSGSTLTQIVANADQGNPNAQGSYLWKDQESSGKLFVSSITGSLPSGSVGAATEVGKPASFGGGNRTQPFFHPASATLFYSQDNLHLDSMALTGDPTLAGGWAPVVRVIGTTGGGSSTGNITAVGESSVAVTAAGVTELYFLYAVKTANSVNLNVGTMPKN